MDFKDKEESRCNEEPTTHRQHGFDGQHHRLCERTKLGGESHLRPKVERGDAFRIQHHEEWHMGIGCEVKYKSYNSSEKFKGRLVMQEIL